MTAGIRAEQLAVTIDKATLLHPTDLSVEAGTWLSIIGPNGAGKSTLLRALVGAARSKGTVTVNGVDVASMKRTGAEGDFRSNLHRGGSAKAVRITKEEREAAVRAARAFALGTAGVDLLRSETGPKVLEVNSSPGLEGIEAVSGKDVAGIIIEHLEKNARPGNTKTRGKG